MRDIFLEAKDLLKVYGPTVAVNHLSIHVYKGGRYLRWLAEMEREKVL